MTEDVKNIRTIYGKLMDALTERSKIEHAKYEIRFVLAGVRSFNVSPEVRAFFSRKFLGKVEWENVTLFEITAGFQCLEYASRDSYDYCKRLFEKLISAYEILGIRNNVGSNHFINLMSFDYFMPIDAMEDYDDPFLGFDDAINRRDYWQEVNDLLDEGEILPIASIWRKVKMKRFADSCNVD